MADLSEKLIFNYSATYGSNHLWTNILANSFAYIYHKIHNMHKSWKNVNAVPFNIHFFLHHLKPLTCFYISITIVSSHDSGDPRYGFFQAGVQIFKAYK